ncbi:hypothetical protein RB614_19715 [Phytohabitans sp. ZYX-F-186]|uniref:BAAT/Acyl-CoA thioester hydrolase C-terminal domain-containing protein n=1 Tax=Phytohabitans maris TaxID=3071409 RepID=A0ABU0ZI97_9ACTN|nr:hypothetical protein [Phytohabitans sp. ZYX-F-186]MDQ7906747.1 hypothetical protein [Phytohabitans sp. ZYX-F-186]
MATTPTIRGVLIACWFPVALTLSETIGKKNPAFLTLAGGHDIVLPAEALAIIADHPQAPDLTVSAWWRLSGPNTLTPASEPT